MPPDIHSVLERYERPLLAFARALSGDAESARDAVQDTLLRYLKEPPAGELEALAPWLFTVCRRRLTDFHRKLHRLVPMDTALTFAEAPDEITASPAAVVEQRDDAGRLRALIKQLPGRDRELVQLKFEAGLAYKDIAAATGLTVSNVGYRLHHAVQLLREQFHAAPVA